ncbi:hypothetical protein RUM43_011294 [Polyplax serrata]|uniref:Uncharacterized protein n=1 Tax=Polyplax serrata TaxID=468196 RepID=A0AAN8P6U9_POLSC
MAVMTETSNFVHFLGRSFPEKKVQRQYLQENCNWRKVAEFSKGINPGNEFQPAAPDLNNFPFFSTHTKVVWGSGWPVWEEEETKGFLQEDDCRDSQIGQLNGQEKFSARYTPSPGLTGTGGIRPP